MREKNELVRIFDVVVQVAILLSPLFSYIMMLWGIFIGAIWQQSSYWIIRWANRGAQNEVRKVYWFAARIVLAMFIAGLSLLYIGIYATAIGGLGHILLLLSFIGGVILYICYFLICLKELAE